MRIPKGLSTTAGISIIAIAIVLVGVAIYFVYIQTADERTTLSISLSDRVVFEKGTTTEITGNISGPRTGAVSLSVTSAESLEVTLSKLTIQPQENFTLNIFSDVATEGDVIVRAEQNGASVSKTVSVKVFSDSVNLNENTNTPQTNTNESTIGTLSDGELNISMEYPKEWGDAVIPTLVNHAPVEGKFRYAYFSNIMAEDVPGRIYITASSTDYFPASTVGTPFWFAETLSPSSTIENIASQIRKAGIEPFGIKKVTLDSRVAVRFYGYFDAYHNYLTIAYAIPFPSLASPYATLMLMRTIDIIVEKETPIDEVYEQGRELADLLEQKKGTEQAQRRLSEFDATVENLKFVQ